MAMASVRTTFTVEDHLLERAKALGVNVSAAARDGLAEAIRLAMVKNDIDAYKRNPELIDPVWGDLETWGDE